MASDETQRKQLQIVAIVLATGPLLFLGVVVFLRSLPDGAFAGEPATTFLTPISCLVAVSAILLHFVLSTRIRGDLIRGMVIAPKVGEHEVTAGVRHGGVTGLLEPDLDAGQIGGLSVHLIDQPLQG